MKNLAKTIVASTPLFLALAIGYTAQPILYVAKKLTELGIYAHEKLGTNLGVEITKKRQTMKQAVAMVEEFKRRMQEQMQNTSTEGEDENRLAQAVRPSNEAPKLPSNVFVLGKKDDESGSKN